MAAVTVVPLVAKKGRKLVILDTSTIHEAHDSILRTTVPKKIRDALKLQVGDMLIWRIVTPEKASVRVFKQEMSK